MIRINECSDVVVATSANAYNLSDPEQYKAFLLWLTDPDGSVEIPASLFEADPACPAAVVEKSREVQLFSLNSQVREKK